MMTFFLTYTWVILILQNHKTLGTVRCQARFGFGLGEGVGITPRTMASTPQKSVGAKLREPDPDSESQSVLCDIVAGVVSL